MVLTRQEALDLLRSKMQNQNLRRHCYCVEAVMKMLAQHFQNQELGIMNYGEINKNKWGIVGLLHDGDYEFTKDDPANHAKLMAQWVRDLGENDSELIEGILSHGLFHEGKPPRNLLEWSLFCCDELTGLIVAVALVQPTKKLADVKAESVLKKFPQKSFAAGVKREDIKMCEEKLKIPLPEFVEITLKAMQKISDQLGV